MGIVRGLDKELTPDMSVKQLEKLALDISNKKIINLFLLESSKNPRKGSGNENNKNNKCCRLCL